MLVAVQFTASSAIAARADRPSVSSKQHGPNWPVTLYKRLRPPMSAAWHGSITRRQTGLVSRNTWTWNSVN
jgi:hypothetical protein